MTRRIPAGPPHRLIRCLLARWGVDPGVIDELLPAADRALDGSPATATATAMAWSNTSAAPTGAAPPGLEGLPGRDQLRRRHAGRAALALVEVQAYVYAAYRARAELAAALGNDPAASRYSDERAQVMKRRINQLFWLPEAGYYAVGLDADKRPIDSLTLNMDHVLWAGAADEDKAAVVAERLLSAELFSGYGNGPPKASVVAVRLLRIRIGSTRAVICQLFGQECRA